MSSWRNRTPTLRTPATTRSFVVWSASSTRRNASPRRREPPPFVPPSAGSSSRRGDTRLSDRRRDGGSGGLADDDDRRGSEDGPGERGDAAGHPVSEGKPRAQRGACRAGSVHTGSARLGRKEPLHRPRGTLLVLPLRLLLP